MWNIVGFFYCGKPVELSRKIITRRPIIVMSTRRHFRPASIAYLLIFSFVSSAWRKARYGRRFRAVVFMPRLRCGPNGRFSARLTD